MELHNISSTVSLYYWADLWSTCSWTLRPDGYTSSFFIPRHWLTDAGSGTAAFLLLHWSHSLTWALHLTLFSFSTPPPPFRPICRQEKHRDRYGVTLRRRPLFLIQTNVLRFTERLLWIFSAPGCVFAHIYYSLCSQITSTVSFIKY